MKRLVLALCALLVAWFGLLGLVSLLASDETKLTWMLETMEAGYNRGHVRDTLGSLGDDWRHAGYSYTKQDLHAGLVAEFFQGRHPETGKPMRRVTLDWESLAMQLGDECASLQVEGAFERLSGASWEPKWEARFYLELVDGERGWEIRSTRHEDLSGTQLSR